MDQARLPVVARFPLRRLGAGATTLLLSLAAWLLLASTAALAASRSPAEARAAAARWAGRSPKHLGVAIGAKVDRVETFKDTNSDPVYYVVYLKPSGFLIMPADDCVEPVVCFARTGSYDPSDRNPLGALADKDLPGRVREARAGAEAARRSGREFAPAGRFLSARRKWDALLAPPPETAAATATGLEAGAGAVSDPRVDPLVQSRWNQSTVAGLTCYNYYTPSNYVCGCVATAMAQLMRYHQHPVAGVGTTTFAISVDGVDTTEDLRGGNGSGGAYDWASMVLVPDGSITSTQRKAIGALTHDAGVSVGMDYAAAGSGADTLEAADQLVATFGYGNAVKGWNGGATIGAGLTAMLNANLDASRPALLGISGPDGGHAVVCDGYGYEAATLYHHLNMGWSGVDDAWYNLPTIDATFTFNTVYKCVYNVCKTGGGEIISGRVDNGSGSPIAGMTITATRAGGGTFSSTTNARGIYALTGLPSASNYTVTASRDGYSLDSQAVATGTSSDFASTSGNYWGLDFDIDTPFIGRSPTTLSFSTNVGANPAAQSVSITNPGGGTLAWTAWNDKPWLQLSPTWGTTTVETDALAVSAAVSQAEEWTGATSTTGTPAARHKFSAVWTGKNVIVWGGLDGSGSPISSSGRYDPAADTWSGAISAVAAPSARCSHSAVWTGEEMIIWGGDTGGPGSETATNTGACYNPSANSWSAMSAVGAPSARWGHCAVWTGTEMIVWGGRQVGAPWTFLNDGARYNPSTDTWTAMTGVGAPTARDEFSAIWTGSQMIVWGGWQGAATLNTGARYNPTGDTWVASTATVGAPAARASHQAVWTGSEMIVWGGTTDNATTIATGSRYNPSSNTWTAPTTTTAAPSARRDHQTVWTGSEMIVWGGYDGSALATGALYRPPISLSAGTYTGTITLTDPEATNNPRTVAVTLTVKNPSSGGGGGGGGGGGCSLATSPVSLADASGTALPYLALALAWLWGGRRMRSGSRGAGRSTRKP